MLFRGAAIAGKKAFPFNDMRRGPTMQVESFEYYRARERAERKAAEQAQCLEARAAHEQLAQAYAEMAGRLGAENRRDG
jgi:predicted kinase